MDSFDAVGVNVHQFMRLEQRLDLRSQTGQQCMKLPSPQISKSQVHYPGRRRLQYDAFREIRVLGDNDQFPLPCKLPNACVRQAVSQLRTINHRATRFEQNAGREAFIEEKTLHVIGTTE